uniref:Uncharacterized protein n=1 Tax=Laticauda laticaudata TaxID=8630 RepID=A0A8C5SGW0_LATLA
MKTFLLNAISWLSAGKERMVGIGDSLQELYSMLNQAEIPCELTNFKEGLGIYCCMAYDAKEMESIHEFVSEGGGLLIGGQITPCLLPLPMYFVPFLSIFVHLC